ncbi:Uncharacterised protein [Anaerobiospirillum thomasii]|uniref:hypothetical protein n=1 Tax=Anaerobiospirillum thomasii TaxID=179995 RepID=UPI000D8258C3|nr:hypothetical protein [Anaerobiospirillum thomasii]SPT72037.1 Uncharacterised protein [Anaerobiospirillum thomasii]
MSISKRFTEKRLTVSFYIKKEAAQQATRIDLLCEHNGWQPVAMKPQKNGTFRGSITVDREGQKSYQYRFKLTMPDGSVKFDNDWDAELYQPNPFGGDNSVFTTENNKAK